MPLLLSWEPIVQMLVNFYIYINIWQPISLKKIIYICKTISQNQMSKKEIARWQKDILSTGFVKEIYLELFVQLYSIITITLYLYLFIQEYKRILICFSVLSVSLFGEWENTHITQCCIKLKRRRVSKSKEAFE